MKQFRLNNSSFLFDIHFHAFETEIDSTIIGYLSHLFGFLKRFIFIFVGEIFLFEGGKLIFFLFAFTDILFGRVVSDKFVTIILFRLKLKVFVALINVFIIKLVVFVLILKCLAIILIILNLYFDLISENEVIIEIIQWVQVILLDDLPLRLDDLFHVLNHSLLNLQIYLQLNILKL